MHKCIFLNTNVIFTFWILKFANINISIYLCNHLKKSNTFVNEGKNNENNPKGRDDSRPVCGKDRLGSFFLVSYTQWEKQSKPGCGNENRQGLSLWESSLVNVWRW